MVKFSIVSADGRTSSLRALREDDRARLFDWRNDVRIRRVMRDPAPIDPTVHDAWFGRVLDAGDVAAAIFEVDGEPSGFVSLSAIDLHDGNARWGFYLRPAGAPAGSGSRMGFLMLRHAFDDLDLHRVYADVVASNAASLRMHEKLGFVEEGRQREHVRRAGGREDLVLFGLLAPEFGSQRAAVEARLF